MQLSSTASCCGPFRQYRTSSTQRLHRSTCRGRRDPSLSRCRWHSCDALRSARPRDPECSKSQRSPSASRSICDEIISSAKRSEMPRHESLAIVIERPRSRTARDMGIRHRANVVDDVRLAREELQLALRLFIDLAPHTRIGTRCRSGSKITRNMVPPCLPRSRSHRIWSDAKTEDRARCPYARRCEWN